MRLILFISTPKIKKYFSKIQEDTQNMFSDDWKSFQYQFKLCLATASLGVSGSLKGDEKKLELWVNGRNEIYTLEAKNKQAKENFAAELRKVVIRQKEIQRSADQRTNGVQQQVNKYKMNEKYCGLSRDMNPGPRAPEARIISLDHWADVNKIVFKQFKYWYIWIICLYVFASVA